MAKKVTGNGNGGELVPIERGERVFGRPPGAQNKTTRILKDALILSAELAGKPEEVYDADGNLVEIKPGPGGLEAFLLYCALYHTKAYLSLLGRVLPLQVNMKVEPERTVVYESVEQVRRIIVERGLDKLLRDDVVVPLRPRKG